jgi:hypothetical protein
MSSLTEMLGRIKKGPAQIHDTGEGGPVIALALHCESAAADVDPQDPQLSGPCAGWIYYSLLCILLTSLLLRGTFVSYQI